MGHHDGHQEAIAGSRAAGSDARAAGTEAGGEARLAASQPAAGPRPGLGGLWLLLVPLACCGGPLLIAGLAAAGVLALGALGLGAGVLVAVTVLVAARRRRRVRRYCEPGVSAAPGGPGSARR